MIKCTSTTWCMRHELSAESIAVDINSILTNYAAKEIDTFCDECVAVWREKQYFTAKNTPENKRPRTKMSRGIWTKHLSVDGKAYFYNSAQNRSVWIPPPESIIHEAINMRPPTYIELAGASSSYGKSSENDVMSNSHGLPAPEQVNSYYDLMENV